ncbi:MAG: hypothetical protein R3F04_10970 [Lysobacteraceae bacterium]
MLSIAEAQQPLFVRPFDATADLVRFEEEKRNATADERFWLQRVATYTAISELESISELIPRLIEQWPNQPVFREAQMILLNSRGETTIARRVGEQVINDFPDYASIRSNLARVYFNDGDLPSALNAMIAAVERGPIRIQDWEFLLQVLARAEPDRQRTFDLLSKKIQANPEMKGLRYLQVILLTRFGQLAAARDVLEAHPELTANPELQRFVADVNAVYPQSTAKR